MTNASITQSQKRFEESVGKLFEANLTKTQRCLFLSSSTDVGVIRNGGRNGARFAPKSFLSTFKKFTLTNEVRKYSFESIEVSRHEEEIEDFHSAQLKESERISSILDKNPGARICHIGGGHDHIYPLLVSLEARFDNIIVINIDAHADTRTDLTFSSGTPFRQFAEQTKGHFNLFQIGLHPFANSMSTLTPLSCESHILWRNDFSGPALDQIFKEISDLTHPRTAVVYSLDADALSASEVPGVSAVNPSGLTKKDLMEIWNRYVALPITHPPILGIYELNPIYDSLASLSMRTIGSFIFETL